MTIDGINISTFGLKLSYFGDFYNLPGRKKILDEPGTQAKDIVYDSNEATVTLIGSYASKAAMKTAIDNLYALIKSNTTHDYILIGHNNSFTGAIMGGIRVENVKTVAKVTFKITITE